MAKSKPETIVKPIIQVEGQTNEFQKLLEEGKLPVLTAIGHVRLDPTKSHNWVAFVIKTDGKKILSIEVDEPNMMAVAVESLKTNFTNLFMLPE